MDANSGGEVQALRDEIARLRSRMEELEAENVIAEAMDNISEAIVIYDAEDQPEPDQLRKAAAAFRGVPMRIS